MDEQDFITAYDEHADAIFRFCAFQVGDRERAKDLMQETFTRTWSYLNAGNEIANLKAFLYRTARNLSINESVRARALSLDAMQESVGFDPADEKELSPEDDAEAALLMKHLNALDPPKREALTLRYIDGLPVQEIAELLGEAPNTVSVRIHRALEELKKRMHA